MSNKPKIKYNDYNDLVDFREYERLTPLKAIKFKCKECCCWNSYESRQCENYDCPLQQFINRKQRYRVSEEDRERRKNNSYGRDV